jgi:DNA-binding MarR family transcriptional regulator
LIADLIQRIERLESKLEQTDSVAAIKTDSSFKNEGGVTQGELAKRLGCDSSTLTKNRKKPSFDEWSRRKDPEGKAWKYLSDMQRYGLVQDKSS